MSGQEALAGALGALRRPLLLAGFACALFLLAPIAIVIISSVNPSDFLLFPPSGISARWYVEALTDRDWRAGLAMSLRTALLAGLLATVAGTAGALGARRLAAGTTAIRTTLVAPLVVPILAYAVGLYLALGRVGLVGSALGVTLGQAMLAMPLVYLVVYAALSEVDDALLRAGASLGAPWWMVAARVELPLVARAIAAGALFATVYAFDEVIVALYLASPSDPTLPVMIWNSAVSEVSPLITAVGTLVLLAVIVVLVVVSALLRRPAGRRA